MPASAAASRPARGQALYDDDGGMAPRIRRRTFHAAPVSAWRRAAHARSRRHQQLSSAVPNAKDHHSIARIGAMVWAPKYDATDQAVAHAAGSLRTDEFRSA